MAKQLFFDFYPAVNSGEKNLAENFISSQENQEAQQKLRDFFVKKLLPIQENFGQNDAAFLCSNQGKRANFLAKSEFGQFSAIILEGDSSCGKTLLLRKFSQEFGAIFIAAEEVSPGNFSQNSGNKNFTKNLPHQFQENHYFLLDDANQVEEEELLFLLNFAAEKKSFLVLALPKSWQPNLPDLASRIHNLPRATIHRGEIKLLLEILTQKLATKQIILEPKILNLIAAKAPRNYQFFNGLAKKIEFFCFENGEKFSLNQAQKILTNDNLEHL